MWSLLLYNLIRRTIQRDAVINVHSFHVKYPIFSSDFNQTSILSTDFRKVLKFHENPFSGSRVFLRGLTDRQDAADYSALRSFANAPKNCTRLLGAKHGDSAQGIASNV